MIIFWKLKTTVSIFSKFQRQSLIDIFFLHSINCSWDIIESVPQGTYQSLAHPRVELSNL